MTVNQLQLQGNGLIKFVSQYPYLSIQVFSLFLKLEALDSYSCCVVLPDDSIYFSIY